MDDFAQFIDDVSRELSSITSCTTSRTFTRKINIGHERETGILVVSLEQENPHLLVFGPGGGNRPTAAIWSIPLDHPTILNIMTNHCGCDDLLNFTDPFANALRDPKTESSLSDEEPLQCATTTLHPKLKLALAYKDLNTRGIMEVKSKMRTKKYNSYVFFLV